MSVLRPPISRQHLATAGSALFLIKSDGRSIRSSLAWLAVVVAIVVIPFRTTFFGAHAFTNLSLRHTNRSLNQALMLALCGRPGPDSDLAVVDVFEAVRRDERLLRQPFVNTIVLKAGSLEAFCGDPAPTFLNNENSLMRVMEAGLRLNLRLSPLGLGRWLGGIRLALLLLFVYVALQCGAPVALSAAALAAAASIQSLQDAYNVYAFLLPILVAVPAYYVAIHRWLAVERLMVLLPACVVAGIASAFCVNVRTSFLPTYCLLFAVFLVSLRRRFSSSYRASLVLLASICFGLGFWAFDETMIRPLERSQTLNVNYSYHPIAHPLVLSLALPEHTPLSRREGITWSDSTGPVLAHRMIPDAEFLGPKYEKALFLYYIKLWLLYPREMVGIYRAKLSVAGVGAFGDPRATEKPAIMRAISVFGRIHSGAALLCWFLAIGAAGAAWFLRRGSHLGLLLNMLAVAAAMMIVEGVAVYPLFWLNYHSYLLFFIALTELLVLQSVVEAIAWRVRRRTLQV